MTGPKYTFNLIVLFQQVFTQTVKLMIYIVVFDRCAKVILDRKGVDEDFIGIQNWGKKSIVTEEHSFF